MHTYHCLLYTSDAADERSSVDLGGRRIIKKKNTEVVSMLAQSSPTKKIDIDDKQQEKQQ